MAVRYHAVTCTEDECCPSCTISDPAVHGGGLRERVMRKLHSDPQIMACLYPRWECSCAAADYVDRLFSSGLLPGPA
ncbi:hypothetical protein [Pseudonocardia parietis]|uniref:Uncharacterized protein n=1 Tax=Pseudonocardia parietis TaxID=570936 RepID=A0ABS4W1V6_9PSEU|nr:hypothetical protein [Pseudonocardia parietis]MBP2370192.1 hypothetical protein [Pseudonocardia parietis]